MNARLLVLLSCLFGAPMFGQGTTPPGPPQLASLPAFGARDCDEKGLLESVGTGTPGTNGIPQLGIFGAPLQGLPFSFEVTGALPNAHGCFGFSVNETPNDLAPFGATLFPGAPLSIQVFVVDSKGVSPHLAEVPVVSPAICGAQFTVQAVVVDPAASGGIAFTKAMRVRFGGPPSGPLFPGPKLLAGAGPVSVAIEDLDGDGVPDLAVVNGASVDVSVLLGAGDGTFGRPLSYSAGAGPTSVAIEDLDGDGVPDLAVANIFSKDVTVLLNQLLK